jgi:hypothetical protein
MLAPMTRLEIVAPSCVGSSVTTACWANANDGATSIAIVTPMRDA